VEVVEEGMDSGRKVDVVVCLVSEGLLQNAEDTLGFRDTKEHDVEIAQEQLVPLDDSNALLERIARRRSTRCGGGSIVRRTVSTSQPRTMWRVAQQASPFRSFLTEAGS
jgi:hypothetical protein